MIKSCKMLYDLSNCDKIIIGKNFAWYPIAMKLVISYKTSSFYIDAA